MSAEAAGMVSLPALVAPAAPWAPFVGRDRELGALRAALADAVAGRGRLVLLSGAAGVGKTTLAEVLAREAAGAGEGPPRGPPPPPPPAGPRPCPRLDGAASQGALFAQARACLAAMAAQRPL